MTDRLQFVCVSHRPELYRQYIADNPQVNHHALHCYDNRVNNIGVAERYNQFIDEELPSLGDAWIIFLHHDFCFDEDPAATLASLSPDAIYGPIGCLLEESGKPYVKLKLLGAGRGLSLGLARPTRLAGTVKCSAEYIGMHSLGRALERPERVDTVDCCCLIAHSSLIRRHGLRFDPRLAWHFYSEDFSLTARSQHGVQTWVAPFRSGHYGAGIMDAAFATSREYLLAKHGSNTFSSTCYTPPCSIVPLWRTSIRHGFCFPLPSFFTRFVRT